MTEDPDRTAAFMSPAKLAQLKQKPAANPAAFLDQMAADVGHQNVKHLGELCARLLAQGGERDFAAIATGLEKLGAALSQIDFELLKPQGWLARATGKQRSAGAEFSAQYEGVLHAAQELKLAVQAQQKQAIAGASATERALVEFDVECSALEKILEQGARWLHDMREDLKARQAAGPDESQLARMRDDASRAETLQTRLRAVKPLTLAARAVHTQAHAAAQNRSAILQAAQHLFSTQFKNWQGRMAPVASAAGDSGSPALSLEGPTDAHRELSQFIDKSASDCRQLQAVETALAASLAALGEPLKAAS